MYLACKKRFGFRNRLEDLWVLQRHWPLSHSEFNRGKYSPVYAIGFLPHIAGMYSFPDAVRISETTSMRNFKVQKCAGPSATATFIGGISSPLYEGALQLQNRGADD
jgi:hypothetical protein